MIHLVLIAIVLTVYLGGPLDAVTDGGWPMGAGVAAAGAAMPLAYAWAVRRAVAALGTARGRGRLRRLDRWTPAYQLGAVAWLAAAIAAGWLAWLRGGIGDLVLVDELLAMLPAIGLIVWQWLAYYPIDRRLREASLMGGLDAGRPVYPIWTRGQYLLAQMRHHLALILGPVLPMLAWSEWLARLATGVGGEPVISEAAAGGLTLGGAAMIFLFAPLLIVRLWHTRSLPSGEIRETLSAMCRRAGVKVRDLLVWHSHGGVVNAAVMGLVAPLRFVLLSDGLLDQLERPHVEAVMAHELGHVKKKHMPTLAMAAIGSLGLIEVGVRRGLASIGGDGLGAWGIEPAAVSAVAAAGGLAAWAGVFGWVSRRIEREADVFAVRTLVSERGGTEASGGRVIDAESAQQMIGALGRVAALAHVDPRRRSWRHGSIAWRQRYLGSLVGKPADRLPIDRAMRRVRAASVAMVIGLIAAASGLV